MMLSGLLTSKSAHRPLLGSVHGLKTWQKVPLATLRLIQPTIRLKSAAVSEAAISGDNGSAPINPFELGSKL